MSLAEIKRFVEKRKYNLTDVLQVGREEIDLSRQHQIYGAIKELENILKTIEYHQEQETNASYAIDLSGEQGTSVIERMSLKLKKSMRISREDIPRP